MLSDRDAAARAYERAGDAFMEAGDYARATNDYLIAANALRHQSASRALALFERVLALFGSDNPLSTEQRASILYSRAELLFARGELEAALASAHEAVTLRTPLTGIDEQKASSMYLAAQIADTLGATEAAKRFHEDAEQLAATFVGHAATRRRFVAACAGDATVDLETLRNEAITEGDAQLEALCDICSAIESPLPFEERIAVADRARARIDQAQLADRDKELVALAFAELYRGHGDDARALNWYLRLLDVSPEHEIGARQAVRLLFKLQRWSEAVRILEMQVSLYGESIRLLLPLSEALIACGRPHDAVDRLVKAQELASSERDSDRVFTLLKKAKAAAKTVPPPSPAARQQAATLSDLEETLRAFKQHVEAQRRMEFWKRKKPKEKTRGSAPKPAADGDPDQHQWRSGPEATAKSLLWSYLEGACRTSRLSTRSRPVPVGSICMCVLKAASVS